jgi:predicted TIM-barrel fold metal-dependent hydrolase
MICGVNPSDLNAVDHVKRMYYKYPRMWRGVGELIGRHDDLKNHSVETEVPRADHAGLLRIYEFCQEVGLPVILHHTADRKQAKTAAANGADHDWVYKQEVERVLKAFPKLRFVWAHAGMSKQTVEAAATHATLLAKMLQHYSNLHIDISWVVWEAIICDENGPKEEWVKLIQKYSKRISIGSDQVANFWLPGHDGYSNVAKNLLAPQVTIVYDTIVCECCRY